MNINISECDLFLIAEALQKAAAYEIENLAYARRHRGKTRENGVRAARSYVVSYMALRRRLLERGAKHERKDSAEVTRIIEKDGAASIVKIWNRVMRRFREDVAGDANQGV